MAETTKDAVGLLSLFSRVVDYFEYVRIAKTFESDFATIALIKLNCGCWRLTRWGEAVGIQDGSAVYVPGKRYRGAEIILERFELLWTEARKRSDELHRLGVGKYEMYEVDDMEPVQAVVHSGVREKIRKSMGRHEEGATEPERASRVEKAKWALYQKQELIKLAKEIEELVSQLEIRLPPGGGMVRVSEFEVEEFPGPARPTLQAMAEKEFAELQDAVQNEAAQDAEQQLTVTPLQVAETLREGAQGQDPYLEDVVNKIIKQLRPSAQTAGATYHVHSRMHTVQNNSGVVSALFHGNQNNYQAEERGS